MVRESFITVVSISLFLFKIPIVQFKNQTKNNKKWRYLLWISLEKRLQADDLDPTFPFDSVNIPLMKCLPPNPLLWLVSIERDSFSIRFGHINHANQHDTVNLLSRVSPAIFIDTTRWHSVEIANCILNPPCFLDFFYFLKFTRTKGSIQNWRFTTADDNYRPALFINRFIQLSSTLLPQPKKKSQNMLGGGSSSSSSSSGGAFSCSSSPALPPARRHHQQTAAAAATAAIVAASTCWSPTNPFNVLSSGGSVVVPSTASEDATVEAAAVPPHFSYANAWTTLPIQRKRPGCSCDHEDYQAAEATSSGGGAYYDYPFVGDCEHVEPLDLSLPKVKVRQHWSGGSIVQVNDSTIISIDRRPDRPADLCCSGCVASDVAGPSPSRLNVSVVTVPQQRQSCWPSSSAFQPATIDRQHPFRLQIEIPFGASDEKVLPGLLRHHHHHRRKSVHTAANNNSNPVASSGGSALQLHPPEMCTSVTTEGGVAGTREDDDLQRLSVVAHQLRLSGYYYGHLSWKESVHLLENTKVYSRHLFWKCAAMSSPTHCCADASKIGSYTIDLMA